MKILAVGDVVGKPGREALKTTLSGIRKQYQIDLVIANGENAAGGLGLTQTVAEDMFNSGVDIITSGNHIWKRKEITQYIDRDVPVIRPLNYPPGVPGKGYYVHKDTVMVVNIIGRTFINNYDCPFRAMDELLKTINPKPKFIIVDFHAEATSEKVAMGWYLDGRVSALFGTHTHVGTIDTRILPNGTAYVTDIGMVGPLESVIGANKEAVLHSFLTLMPTNLSIGKGDFQFNSVLINLNNDTGLAQAIKRIDLEMKNYES
jgi:metallophosphoesterase (TIGR00282 family)